MAGNMNLDLEHYTDLLQDLLRSRADEIVWVQGFIRIVETIQRCYATCFGVEGISQPVLGQLLKTKELEKSVAIDTVRHIALRHVYTPYYFDSVQQLLNRALSLLNSCDKVNTSSSHERELDHLSADLQAVIGDHGFYKTFDVMYEVDDVIRKLDSLDNSLAKVKTAKDIIAATDIIHEVYSTKGGILQAVANNNRLKIKSKYDTVSFKLHQALDAFVRENFKPGSPVVMEYLAHQHLVKNPRVGSLYHGHSRREIEKHIIVPGTRVWVLERVQRWIHNPERRNYYIGGKRGSGKTALASTICKLFNDYVAGSHFFDGSDRSDPKRNTLCGMIQSLAYGLCCVLPEYANWMDDSFKGNETELSALLSQPWRNSFDRLLKQPLQEMYGKKWNGPGSMRRKVFVVDGCDELSQSEWADFKQFQGLVLKELSPAFCLLITVRFKHFASLAHVDEDATEGVKFEDKAWYNRHIKDIEVYISSSLGAILSGEDERESPQHAKTDESTLQNAVDELLMNSAGRFSIALGLMEHFASDFGTSGQFLGSLKKCVQPVRDHEGAQGFDERVGQFSSPYRSYRDKEGRSVAVRVMRQSQYPMDKTRVALIRRTHNF